MWRAPVFTLCAVVTLALGWRTQLRDLLDINASVNTERDAYRMAYERHSSEGDRLEADDLRDDPREPRRIPIREALDAVAHDGDHRHHSREAQRAFSGEELFGDRCVSQEW